MRWPYEATVDALESVGIGSLFRKARAIRVLNAVLRPRWQIESNYAAVRNRKLTRGKHCIDVERRNIFGINPSRIILPDGRRSAAERTEKRPDALELA
jgi:hypothetical protein